MKTRRTHVVFPETLIREIDKRVGKRGRSRFLAELAERELLRLRQLEALDKAAGSWKDEDHPELKDGAAKWVEQLRAQDEERDERLRRLSRD